MTSRPRFIGGEMMCYPGLQLPFYAPKLRARLSCGGCATISSEEGARCQVPRGRGVEGGRQEWDG